MSTFVTIERPAPRNEPRIRAANYSIGFRLLDVVRFVEERLEKRRSRVMLLSMTDAELKDIGVSRADAHGEARRGLFG